MGYCRQIDKVCTFPTYQSEDVSGQTSTIICQGDCQTIWCAHEYCVKLGSEVYIKVLTVAAKISNTQLRMSSAYHPQTDGQSERTIQSLEDLLRTCILDHLSTWSDMLPLVEFTYSNNYHSSTEMAPYEPLYARRCRTPLCWQQDGESIVLGPKFLQVTTEKVKIIQDHMRATQSRQKSYVDKRRRSLEFKVGDHVFLKVTPIAGLGRDLKSRKLTHRFIRSYQITRRIGPVAYEIALPPHLENLHNVFHVS